MKKVQVKFTVVGSNNLYFATSQKTKESFCRKSNLSVDIEFNIRSATDYEASIAEKCGRGVFLIDGNRNLIS